MRHSHYTNTTSHIRSISRRPSLSGVCAAIKFAENVYYHELARQLRSFDYQINNHPRGDFQIEGVSEEICDRFSKQDVEVDRALVKLLAEKPEFASANIKELRSKLATQHRTRKQKDLSRAELRTLWDAQLSDAECISLRQLPNRSENIANTKPRVEIGEAVQWAEDCSQANLTARGNMANRSLR